MKHELPKIYTEIRALILSGEMDEAAKKITNLEKGLGSEWKKLLQTRLALKSGTFSEHLLQNVTSAPPAFLAEAHFVNGLLYFHLNVHKKGAGEFKQAAAFYFQIEDWQRHLLSLFNHAIGIENSGPTEDFKTRLDRFLDIKRKAFEFNDKKTFGLAARQAGMLYHQMGRPHAAIDEFEKSLDTMELYGDNSDKYSSFLALALIFLELGHETHSKVYFEKVIGRVDARNQLAWDYLAWKLGVSAGVPQVQNYSVICPYFKDMILEKIPLEASQEDLTGQEIKLFHILQQGQASKELLCVALWPELSPKEVKANRLHVLLKRLKTKLSRLGKEITYVKGFYTLHTRK